MNVVEIIKRTEKLAVDNAPALLTAVGVTGTIATAVLAGKASVKASRHIDREENRQNRVLLTKDRVRLTWKYFVPPTVAGAFTIASVVASNRISSKRAAALAAAYSLSDKAFQEYKDKVAEKIGEVKEQAVRDDIARDRMQEDRASTSEVLITGDGNVLCYDMHTGRYFQSNMEELRRAENEINRQIIQDGMASLSDFYDLIGLRPTRFSEEMGWGQDDVLRLTFSTVMSDDNRPCISVDYDLSLKRKYQHFAG